MEIIVQTFGTAISRDNEGFVISNQEGRTRIPVLDVQSIQIGKGAQITSDAIMLAVEREIEVLFVDRSGNPTARVWSPRYGSISTIRKGQLTFVRSSDAVEWIKRQISKKITNQQALLLAMQANNKLTKQIVAEAVSRLEEYISKIQNLHAGCVSDIASMLRGWEGSSSRIYFATMNYFLPDAYKFESRSQHPAKDVVNALLNYGYGILYGKIEGALIKVGIDPYLGILHRDDYNRPVLVYDIIEIYRVWVDYVVYSLVIQNVLTEESYSIKEDGSYWLEPLGRRILIQSLNDYLDEVVLDKGITRSRETHIYLYSQNLAQKFKKFE